MGIHVSLYRLGERYTDKLPMIDYPGYRVECVDNEFGWDFCRHSGDDTIHEHVERALFVDETMVINRPRDVDAFEKEMLSLGYNESRWRQLADILRNNEDIWIGIIH